MPKRKIQLGGQELEAEVIEYQAESENWNTYILHDGTTLRLKPVVTDVLRVDGQFAANGDPIYVVMSSNVLATNAPEQLKRKP